MLVLNKEYMIFNPEPKTTKSGKDYIQFTISDSTKTADGYKNEYYRMKAYHDGSLVLEDRQKVKFTSFISISCYSTTLNGKTYNNRDIFCTVEGSENANKDNDELVERVDNGSSEYVELDLKTDDLPF